MRGVLHRFVAVVGLCLGLCASVLAQSPPEAVAGGAAPAAAAVALTRPSLVAQDAVNAAHTGWMMTSTALVLLMTLPGIALFYAGMVRKKNILATAMQSFAITCLMTLIWFVVGYTLAFGTNADETMNKFIGGFDKAFLAGIGVDTLWLAPFQPSPNRDNGYDICDYYGVNPRHGSSGDAA